VPALTLYLDNSVIGGYFDTEFEDATRRLWTLAEAGQFRFVVSVVTQQEAALAPPDVVDLLPEHSRMIQSCCHLPIALKNWRRRISRMES
jgi:hypothetical protein